MNNFFPLLLFMICCSLKELPLTKLCMGYWFLEQLKTDSFLTSSSWSRFVFKLPCTADSFSCIVSKNCQLQKVRSAICNRNVETFHFVRILFYCFYCYRNKFAPSPPTVNVDNVFRTQILLKTVEKFDCKLHCNMKVCLPSLIIYLVINWLIDFKFSLPEDDRWRCPA